MATTYERSPIDVIEGAIRFGEVQLAEAREVLRNDEMRVEASKITIASHEDHLAKWRQARQALIDSLPESETP